MMLKIAFPKKIYPLRNTRTIKVVRKYSTSVDPEFVESLKGRDLVPAKVIDTKDICSGKWLKLVGVHYSDEKGKPRVSWNTITYDILDQVWEAQSRTTHGVDREVDGTSIVKSLHISRGNSSDIEEKEFHSSTIGN